MIAIIIAMCFIAYKSDMQQIYGQEEFSLGHHEGDFEYISTTEAYPDRIEYLLEYKDGCILWFYFDLETHTPKGWQWIKQVGHGLWG